jgi:hypothetical protein
MIRKVEGFNESAKSQPRSAPISPFPGKLLLFCSTFVTNRIAVIHFYASNCLSLYLNYIKNAPKVNPKSQKWPDFVLILS